MSGTVDVAIVGAGPYGLSVAAHLRGMGVEFRHFGMPLHPWQSAMPQGMFLKSQGFASSLADPAGSHTLAAFCRHAGLPATACTHSSAHNDLSVFRGRDVIVLGGGQSALESAALLHESGARVRVVMRKAQVTWNGPPLPPDRPLLQRMREPEAGLGSGWATWFYSAHPGLFWHLPRATRVHRARTALGPAGASWLQPRIAGVVPVLTGHVLDWARPEAGGVRLGVVANGGTRGELTADHIVAATGYRSDLGRLGFLGDVVRGRLRTVAGTPVVGRQYQSSVPGLFFAGPGVAPSFGPVMRFVLGAAHAAPAIARELAKSAGRRAGVAIRPSQ